MRSSCPRGLGFVACHAPNRSGRGGRTAASSSTSYGTTSELLGRQVAERGVAALAVVEGLDVLEDLGDQLAPRRPRAAVHELFLERREEALGDGVVVAVALGAHRDGDAGVAGLLAEAQAHVLRSLV